MKKVTYISTRLVPETSQEKEVVKSWGSDWKTMKTKEEREGGFLVIFGDWSGYRPEQRRITHVELSPVNKEGDLGTVEYSDGTRMNVWTKRMTREELLESGHRKQLGYSSLIREFIKSGKSYYKV